MTTFIDAHCHLADARFDDNRQDVIARAREMDIHHFIQGGVNPADWKRQQELNDGSWILCFGLHPWHVAEKTFAECEADLGVLDTMIDQAAALGECGLDFSKKLPASSHGRQRQLFKEQLEMAKYHHKPLVLHIVQAHGAALEMLKSMSHSWRGIVHGFNGSTEVAQAYIDLGFSLSIGGSLTRQGHTKLKDAVSHIPLEQLVVESDAPDMAPTDWGQPQNEPASLWLTAKAIGYFHLMTARDVLIQSRRNLCRIFDLEL